MTISLPFGVRSRTLLSLAVWLGSVGTALWLYRQGIGGGDAVGIAQVKEYKVSPSELGRLLSLEVIEGQRVTPGQVVARCETEMIRRELSIAEARLRQITSEVGAATASMEVSSLRFERHFESDIESTEIELKAAQSGLARDREQLSKVTEEIQRQRDLVKSGLTKADRLAALGLQQAALEEAVRAWPPRIQALEARLNAASARSSEWNARNNIQSTARKVRLQPVHDKVDGQLELIQLLRKRLENTVLRAPSDAYVSVVLARPGDVLKAGDPVVTLVEAQPRQVVAYIEERRGTILASGATVVARRRNGSNEQFEGTVATISGQVSQLPARLWINPNLPSWGREVYIQLPVQARLDPGEALDIKLHHGPPTSEGHLAAQSRVSGAGSGHQP